MAAMMVLLLQISMICEKLMESCKVLESALQIVEICIYFSYSLPWLTAKHVNIAAY